jgi:hypothetical protein
VDWVAIKCSLLAYGHVHQLDNLVVCAVFEEGCEICEVL